MVVLPCFSLFPGDIFTHDGRTEVASELSVGVTGGRNFSISPLTSPHFSSDPLVDIYIFLQKTEQKMVLLS